MDKITKTILIFSVVFIGISLFVAPPALAAANLVVNFENSPLFNEANFVPGESVSRWVKVANNSGSAQRIAAETVSENNPDNFASKLNLTIKEGATVIFNNTLAAFFDQGETYLSSLSIGGQTQYDFIITFDSGANDDYQGKILGFDIIIGFEGTDGGLPPPPSGEGGGGGLPVGLTIVNESNPYIGETSVTITWNTSYAATSQVIYSIAGETHILDLTDNAGTPPTYGYSHTTPEYDISPKVTYHSVTIAGLTSGTTYYYRAVSHGSLAISEEYSFVTKGVAGAATTGSETGETAEEVKGTTSSGNPLPSEGEQGNVLPENSEGLSTGTSQGTEGGGIGEAVENNEEKGGNAQNSWLAAIGGIPLGWKILLLILIVVGLMLLILWLIGKRRKKRTKI